MYSTRDKLIVFDVDGTIVDAFGAIASAFEHHGMVLGDLARFQKRWHLFKYLGGVKEFPANLRRQLGKKTRDKLLSTLTAVYRDEAALYPGIPELLRDLIAAPGIRVGLVTRNITDAPLVTLAKLFSRHNIDLNAFDYVAHIALNEDKTHHFVSARTHFDINPSRSYACGDEHRDYSAAIAAAMNPLIVSYGFEERPRLTKKYSIPHDIISDTPEELCFRLRHTLDLTE